MRLTQIVILASLLVFVIVGLIVKRSDRSSYSMFTMDRGQLGWFTIATGISMTFAGGAAILTTASVGYIFKWYSLVDPISIMIGILIVLFIYRKYEKDSGTTISDLLSSNHKGLKVLIGCITSMTFILVVAANFVALSNLLSPYFTSINPLLLTFIISTLVFSYVFLGGFKSVTRTDILQFLLIASLLIVPILHFTIKNVEYMSVSSTTHVFLKMPIDYIILFSIPILFTPLSQDINLRIKSAKNSKQGKLGLLMGGLFYFSITLSVAFVGIYLGNHNFNIHDSEQAIPLFFMTHFPKVGFGAIIASLAAIVSTLDSYILNATTSISNDIISPLSDVGKNVSGTIKIAALLTYVIAMAIALFFNKILLLSLTSLLIYISVLTPIAIGNKMKLPGNKNFIGSIINITTIIIAESFSFIIGPKALVYPLFGFFVIFLQKIFDIIKTYEKI